MISVLVHIHIESYFICLTEEVYTSEYNWLFFSNPWHFSVFGRTRETGLDKLIKAVLKETGIHILIDQNEEMIKHTETSQQVSCL